MSEFDRIARYFAPLAKRKGAARLVDDVAGLSGDASFITVDALVEGVHFHPSDPIETIARKLVRVNVSDVIAKGGRPDEALLTLGWPKTRSEDELARFAKALGEDLSLWGGHLIGGDTVTSPDGLFLSLTLTARPAGPRAPIRRSGAQAGDTIWLSGPIGGGYIGLQDAQNQKDTPASGHYRVPDIPPLFLSDLIAQHATASMDVSDGLIGDAVKLLGASACGGHIALERVQLFASTEDLESVTAQCTGGDDYQCLFTSSDSAKHALLAAMPALYPIGRVEGTHGLKLTWRGQSIEIPKQAGFSH